MVVAKNRPYSAFVVQTPSDDEDYYFFSLSLTDKHSERHHQRDTDWVCLFFAGPGLSRGKVESLLCDESFPHDFAEPLSPDFMFLPVALLCWQVQQAKHELTEINREIQNQDEKLMTTMNWRGVESIRSALFKMEKSYWMLRRRYLFVQEMARNLLLCFERIEKRGSSEDEPAKYSASLLGRVQAQEATLKYFQHDMDATPLRMKAQQRRVGLLRKHSLLLSLFNANQYNYRWKIR
jgi:hypothetical protein